MNTSSILTVSRVTINLGIDIDAYSANEVDPATGKFINYLSGKGLAESIGLADTTTLQKRLSKELKDLLGEGFTTLQGKYKNSSGAYSKINLWRLDFANKYYRYHDRKGNQKAQAIIDALSETTLQIITDDAFGRKYLEGDAQKHFEARLKTIEARNDLTDSVKDFHKGKAKSWDYILRSDRLNELLTGYPAKYWCEKFNISKNDLRNHWSKQQLKRIENVESLAKVKIDEEEMHPVKAIEEAVKQFHYTVWDEKELVGMGDLTTYMRNKKRESRARKRKTEVSV